MMIIRCKYCRFELVKEDSLVHLKGPASEATEPIQLGSSLISSASSCSHFFTDEPPSWWFNTEENKDGRVSVALVLIEISFLIFT